MKKTFLIISVIAVLVFGFYIQRSGDIYYEISRNMELFGKVYKEISFNYVDEINPEEFMREGIKGMLKSLDPYTVFIDESKQENIDLMTNGKYGGIGVTIGVRNDRVTITEILEGYAAQKQGLRIGDVVSKLMVNQSHLLILMISLQKSKVSPELPFRLESSEIMIKTHYCSI